VNNLMRFMWRPNDGVNPDAIADLSYTNGKHL